MEFSFSIRCQSGSRTAKTCSCRVWRRSARATSMPLTSRHNTSTSQPTAWSVFSITLVGYSDTESQSQVPYS